MEATDARQRADVPLLRPLDRSPGRRVAVERHVGPFVVVEPDVLANEPSLSSLAENEDVIEQLASDRSDEPLSEAALPGRTQRDRELLHPHANEPLVEHCSESPIAIADDALGDDIGRHGLDPLLRPPRGRGMRGDLEVQHASALEREHEEDVAHAEARGPYLEEVDGERAREVVADEGSPRLRGRTRARPLARHGPRDRVLPDHVPELAGALPARA